MSDFVIFDMEWNMGYQPKTFRYQGIEQTLRDRSSRSAR